MSWGGTAVSFTAREEGRRTNDGCVFDGGDDAAVVAWSSKVRHAQIGNFRIKLRQLAAVYKQFTSFKSTVAASERDKSDVPTCLSAVSQVASQCACLTIHLNRSLQLFRPSPNRVLSRSFSSSSASPSHNRSKAKQRRSWDSEERESQEKKFHIRPEYLLAKMAFAGSGETGQAHSAQDLEEIDQDVSAYSMPENQ